MEPEGKGEFSELLLLKESSPAAIPSGDIVQIWKKDHFLWTFHSLSAENFLE